MVSKYLMTGIRIVIKNTYFCNTEFDNRILRKEIIMIYEKDRRDTFQ